MFHRTLPLASIALAASAAAAHADVTVIASIKPVQSLVAAVMEGAGVPELIVDGAGSPHTYSLKPSQASALSKADVVFWVGDGLEAFLEKPIETLAGNARSVELVHAPGVETLPLREGGAFERHMHDDEDDHDHEAEHADGHDHESEHDHEAGHDEEAGHDDEAGHDHKAFDMHVWLDPENAKAISRAIAGTLAEVDPENAALYADNAAALADRLDELTTELKAELEPVKDKGFIVFHDGYQYFEHSFDMAAAGSITVSPDVMPGADRLTEIRDKVRELGATCVFAEPQFEPKLISVVTEGMPAHTGVLDPLGAEIEPGPGLYFDLMRAMASSFETCLSQAS